MRGTARTSPSIITQLPAGFNYVDDQCSSYFDYLFHLDRGREQLKSGVIATSATTAAILGVTRASAPSLAIVAAAFGLASEATDIVAGTYLYRLPPATTQGFVAKLQFAFRDEAAKKRAQINSPTTAYYLVQRYLNLCLPPTIEAEIIKQISTAGARAVPGNSGSLFTVESVGAPPPVALRPATQVKSPVIRNISAPLPKPEPVIPRIDSDPRFTPRDKKLFPSQIKAWQVGLCVEPADGKLGPLHSETRKAIRDYLIAQGAMDPAGNSDASFEIGTREEVFLNNLKHNPKKCPGT
jgi:hypothetical protein